MHYSGSSALCFLLIGCVMRRFLLSRAKALACEIKFWWKRKRHLLILVCDLMRLLICDRIGRKSVNWKYLQSFNENQPGLIRQRFPAALWKYSTGFPLVRKVNFITNIDELFGSQCFYKWRRQWVLKPYKK